MPKLICKCGFVHNLSPIPDDGWVTIRDKDYEALIQSEFQLEQGLNEAGNRIRCLKGVLYECPDCQGLMWEKPNSDAFNFYRTDV